MGIYTNFFAAVLAGQSWKTAFSNLLAQLDTDIPSLQAVVGGIASTSASSLSIGTGSKAFTIAESGRSFTVGALYQASRASASGTLMIGAVVSFTAGVLTLSMTQTAGAGGPFTDWVIVPVTSVAQSQRVPQATRLTAATTLSLGGVYLLDGSVAGPTHNLPATPIDGTEIIVRYDTQTVPAAANQHTLQTTDGAGIGQAANSSMKLDAAGWLTFVYSSRNTLWVF